jgi:GDP-mannose transporter
MMDDRKKEDYPISMPPLSGRVPPRFDKQTANGASAITNNPTISILAYCTASISMTVINKFCVSGKDWNLTFFFLAVQVFLALSIASCGH